MYGIYALFSVALLLASSASALVLPRHRNFKPDLLARAPTPVEVAVRAVATQPADWASKNFEDYMTYHIRYMALDCEDQHNTTFFATCCHPRKADAKRSAISAECTPSNKALVSASSRYGPKPTATDDCGGDETTTPTPTATAKPTETEDCGDGEETTTTHHTTSTHTSSSTPATSTPKATAVGAAGNLGTGPKTSTSSSAKPTTTSTSSTHTSTKTTKTSSTETATKTSTSSGAVETGGVATWYTQNGAAGACGAVHSDSAMIAAIDQARYGDSSEVSSLCGQKVKITNVENGKTVTVTIEDDCPTCKNRNSIDLSQGAFEQIASLSTGEVDITWEFVSS